MPDAVVGASYKDKQLPAFKEHEETDKMPRSHEGQGPMADLGNSGQEGFLV